MALAARLAAAADPAAGLCLVLLAAAPAPAGPNGPLGLVWIGLTAPSYGIDGTPEPGEVGMAESHGCVRPTNWDAMALAALVQKGAAVEFVE